MFNPPTKRQRIKQAERRIVPISRQTVLTPDIKKAALERNTRVLREKKIKDSFEVEKKTLSNNFKKDIEDLKKSHKIAIDKLNKDCDDAKRQISNSAQERLRAANEIKNREIEQIKSSHVKKVDLLEREIKDKRSQIENLRKIASSVNRQLEEKKRESRSEKQGDLNTESALKIKLGKAEKEIKEIKSQITKLTNEKIALVRMTDDVDKELKDSLNYIVKISENEIRNKLLLIAKLGEKQINEIDRIIDQNMTLARDIENKSEMKLNNIVNDILNRIQEQKRLGNVQSKVILSLTKKEQQELKNKHDLLIKDIREKSSEKIMEMTRRFKSIETKLNQSEDRINETESEKRKLKKNIEDFQKEKTQIIERFTNEIKQINGVNAKIIQDLKKTHEKEIETQEKKLVSVHQETVERLKKEIEKTNKTLQDNLVIINNKDSQLDKVKEDHLKEITDHRKSADSKIEKVENDIRELKTSHLKAMREKEEIEIALRNDNDKLKKLEQSLKKEIEAGKNAIKQLEKKILDLNLAHSEKLKKIQKDEGIVCAEIKKSEIKKQEVINRLNRKCSEQAKQLTAVLTEKSNLEKKISKLECEVNNSKLAVGISAPDLSHCKISHSELVKKLEELVKSRKDALKGVKKGSEDLTKLRITTQQLEELTKKFEQLNEVKSKLEQRLQESQGRVYDKTMELNKERQELEKIQKKLDKRKTQSVEATKEIKRLQDSLKSNLSQSNSKVLTLEAKVKELVTQNQKRDFEIRSLTTDKTQQKKQIDKTDCEIEQIKEAIGMDSKKLKHCKVTYSKIENKIKELVENNKSKNRRIVALEKANNELTIKNRELQKMIPKMNDLERQISEMKKAARAREVDAEVLKKATQSVKKAQSINLQEEIRILEKAVYLPWAIANCYGKDSRDDREKCKEFERYGSKPKLNEIQKIHIRDNKLVRFSGFSSRPSDSVRNPKLKRKLMLIENTGFITKEFKDTCIGKDGRINLGDSTIEKCRYPRRNFASPTKISATGLSSIDIRKRFR